MSAEIEDKYKRIYLIKLINLWFINQTDHNQRLITQKKEVVLASIRWRSCHYKHWKAFKRGYCEESDTSAFEI